MEESYRPSAREDTSFQANDIPESPSQQLHEQLGHGFQDKRITLNNLAAEIEALERKLQERQQYHAAIAAENDRLLHSVLEAKKASIEEYKKEETEVAEEVAALRKHTKSLMATIKSEKAVSLSNLSMYEDTVGAMCNLFLDKRMSYELHEVEVATQDLEQLKIDNHGSIGVIHVTMQETMTRKEAVHKAYLEMEDAIFKPSQRLMDENVQQTNCKYLENQKLSEKIENIECYLRDREPL
ncbi:unnamed protein product [Bemisia tabaci]|uniref:Uncharacterized protein n=1 Tax=Bemisia tabaci TaxID=7038 RepID=A0A9P0A7X5_BEMTA|nr:unnamed protein product [Bemisia tabaci]